LFRVDIDEPSKVEPVKLLEPLKGADGFHLIDGNHLPEDGHRPHSERPQKASRSGVYVLVNEESHAAAGFR
jgi:hypothetical protein